MVDHWVDITQKEAAVALKILLSYPTRPVTKLQVGDHIVYSGFGGREVRLLANGGYQFRAFRIFEIKRVAKECHTIEKKEVNKLFKELHEMPFFVGDFKYG